MKTLTLIAGSALATLVALVACAPESARPPVTVSVDTGTSNTVHADKTYYYTGDLYSFTVTEFDNSIGEHCTVVTRDSAAIYCSPKKDE